MVYFAQKQRALSWVVLKALKLDFPRSNAENKKIEKTKKASESMQWVLLAAPTMNKTVKGVELESGRFLIIPRAAQSGNETLLFLFRFLRNETYPF